MPKFIKAESGPKDSVIYTDKSGKQFLASGGDRSLRNNNPGNLKPGSVSKRNNEIGVAGGFSVFPDFETGQTALLDSLKNAHGNQDLATMIKIYAPKKENKTAKYLHFLRSRTGVKGNKKIKDFTPEEFESLWKAIEDMEGKKQPSISEYIEMKRISRVRKNEKGTIVAYFVDGLGWLSKEQGIKLAQEKKIDAVIATSSAGNLYLKTRPDVVIENNLDNLD